MGNLNCGEDYALYECLHSFRHYYFDFSEVSNVYIYTPHYYLKQWFLLDTEKQPNRYQSSIQVYWLYTFILGFLLSLLWLIYHYRWYIKQFFLYIFYKCGCYRIDPISIVSDPDSQEADSSKDSIDGIEKNDGSHTKQLKSASMGSRQTSTVELCVTFYLAS